MKSDGLFQNDDYRRPAEDPDSGTRPAGSPSWYRKALFVSVVVVGCAAALLILYAIFQIFVCDLREIVFPGMRRRVTWLCR